MKTRNVIRRSAGLFLLCSLSFTLPAQAPDGFQFQAVARDAQNNLLSETSLNVSIGIRAGSETGELIWQEQHSATTSDLGLFSLVICGEHSVRSGGSASNIADIDWSSGDFFIELIVDAGNGAVTLPVQKFHSVPYAHYATRAASSDDAVWENNIGNAVLINGNVGIGTNNPFYKLEVHGETYSQGIGLPKNFGPDTSYVGSDGNYITFGHQGVSEDFIGYKDNTFYLKDSPGGGDTRDPNLVVGGNLSVGSDETSGMFSIQADENANDSDPLFMIRRKDGYPVFAVYEDGVYAYTDTVNTGKGIKGGFAVGGYRKTSKGIGDEYMRVTADSIRFYVDEAGTSKGVKGGFAVGGYRKTSKGLTGNDYFRVSPDSVRIYIDDDPQAKGIKGGFAVGGYRKTSKSAGDEYFNISGLTSATVINSENRVVWYPKKNAFMAGNILVESPDNVGENSMSTGYQSRAIGDYSEAFGFKSTSYGAYSTAIGNEAYSGGDYSYAIGNNASSTRNGSYAIGSGASATGDFSFALGSSGIDEDDIATSPTKATEDYAYAFGMGSVSMSIGDFSFGTLDSAYGGYSLAMGYNTNAGGFFSTSMGCYTYAGGYYSTATGYRTTATGQASTAMGRETDASGHYSQAFGYQTNASGMYSTAIGGWSTASGELSTAIGWNTTASGDGSISMGSQTISSADASTASGLYSQANGNYSTAMGRNTVANAVASTAMGRYTIAGSYGSVVLGQYNTLTGGFDTQWISSDPLFIIGNGTSSSSRSNAMTVLKNGNIGIGTTNPSSYRLSVWANKLDGYAMLIHNDYNSYRAHGLRIACGYDGTSASTTYAIDFRDGDVTAVGSITIRNHQVYFNATSDRRLKTNIDNTSINGLDMISKLPVVDFAFKDSPDKMLTGFIAQDVEKVYPDAVVQTEEGIYQLSQSSLIPILTKATQEQQEIIETQQREILEQKAELDALRAEMEEIKKLLGY